MNSGSTVFDYTLSDYPFKRIFGRSRFSDSDKKQILLLCIVAWVPLAILTYADGTFFSGVKIPFIYDYALHAKVLISIYLFIFIREPIDLGINTVMSYVSISLLTKEESDKILSPVWEKAKKFNESLTVEITIFIMIIIITILQSTGYLNIGLNITSNTWISPGAFIKLSAAGYWYIFVSKVLFLFLFIKWILKYIIWVWLLKKISETNISIIPVHSDHAGGLGIFIIAQERFCLLFFTIGAVLSGEFIVQLIYYDSPISLVGMQIFGYIFLSLIILVMPLLFFIKKLIHIKMEGMIYYGQVASNISRKFNKDWIKGKTESGEIDEHEIDPSILIDYSSNYDIVKGMRVIPLGLYDVLEMAGMIAIAFFPVLLVQMSFEEILIKLFNILV